MFRDEVVLEYVDQIYLVDISVVNMEGKILGIFILHHMVDLFASIFINVEANN